MDNTFAIQTEHLTKVYGRKKNQVVAVKDLTLAVAAGQVYGFLGPNGAGKTTTIRVLLDLIRPTQGHTAIYGQDARHDHGVLQRAGALVEGAAFYPFLSGRRNLEVLARTGDTYDPDRITTLLNQVGLSDRAERRVGGYSTGMKQRLGLAAALLNDPDLLILDEPTNGLDPAGIQEIRLLIRELVEKHGKTVFLSSHILSEVELVCDRVAIINKGELVREGTVADLLSGHTELLIEARPPDKALAVLAERWPVQPNEQGLTVQVTHDAIPDVVRQLVAAGVDVYQVASQRQSLEAYFLSVTQEAEPEGQP